MKPVRTQKQQILVSCKYSLSPATEKTSDRSHVNARKEMYGGRYELIPVSCKYPLRNKQKSRKSSIKQQDEVQTQTELSGLTEVPFFDDVI